MEILKVEDPYLRKISHFPNGRSHFQILTWRKRQAFCTWDVLPPLSSVSLHMKQKSMISITDQGSRAGGIVQVGERHYPIWPQSIQSRTHRASNCNQTSQSAQVQIEVTVTTNLIYLETAFCLQGGLRPLCGIAISCFSWVLGKMNASLHSASTLHPAVDQITAHVMQSSDVVNKLWQEKSHISHFKSIWNRLRKTCWKLR